MLFYSNYFSVVSPGGINTFKNVDFVFDWSHSVVCYLFVSIQFVQQGWRYNNYARSGEPGVRAATDIQSNSAIGKMPAEITDHAFWGDWVGLCMEGNKYPEKPSVGKKTSENYL